MYVRWTYVQKKLGELMGSELQKNKFMTETDAPTNIYEQTNKDFIRMLEVALEQAKAGGLNALALVKVSRDGEVNAFWSAHRGSSFTLLGGADYLMQRIRNKVAYL